MTIPFSLLFISLIAASKASAQAITLQTPTLLNMALMALCCILLSSTLWLVRDRRAAKRHEQAVEEHYKTLEKQLYEGDKKLKRINHRLNEEIIKHEITEKLLNETQDYMQSIINSMPSILIGITPSGAVTHWNQAAYESTGIHYKQALTNNLYELAPTLNIDPEIVRQAIEKQKPQKLEALQNGDGNETTYRDMTIYPLNSIGKEGVAIRIDDVTLRVNLENMIIQNEKLRSLGELAAGVAHEINNPIGIVLQGVQNIKRRLSKALSNNHATAQELGISLDDVNHYLESREILRFIDDIKDAGEHVTGVVTNMLTFARAQHQQLEDVDLTDLITGSLKMAEQNLAVLKAQTAIDITLETQLPNEKISISCSPIEIQQVLLNILSNAFQSFTNAALSEPCKVTLSLKSTDDEAIIIIRDNGAGMDTWTKKHLFDPFFTTKDVGKGTGLGLSVSYYIVTERHQGVITVDSLENHGSTFTIRLPRISLQE